MDNVKSLAFLFIPFMTLCMVMAVITTTIESNRFNNRSPALYSVNK